MNAQDDKIQKIWQHFWNRLEGGKFDGSAFIDIRNYKKGFNIMPFLLNPNQIQILTNLAKSFLNSQIIIFTQTSLHYL